MQTRESALKALEKKFTSSLQDIKTAEELEKIRVEFLGRSGHIATLMSQLKDLSIEEKRVFGPLLNQFKKKCEELYTAALENMQKQETQKKIDRYAHFDVTATLPEQPKGSLHIFTQITQQIEDIFISMGFDIATGPEVETDYYNFQALNVPEDHPARDLQDTFWLSNPGMLLRTHTSTVQIHAMEKNSPPLALITTGRVYRHEATDATHDFLFNQTEGILIDTNVSIANLLATAKSFLQQFFEKKDLAIRVRPGYFPFVEPGLEIDGSCPFCKKGCSVCKHTTWIELMGAGLVHPEVLKAGNIDPNKYSGFAFGFGIERLAMIKYGINDIRLFRNGSMNFLDQYR